MGAPGEVRFEFVAATAPVAATVASATFSATYLYATYGLSVRGATYLCYFALTIYRGWH